MFKALIQSYSQEKQVILCNLHHKNIIQLPTFIFLLFKFIKLFLTLV